jgi:hypothetical protein
MRSEGILKHFGLAFLLAAAGYLLFYSAIQWHRTRQGPWEITFRVATGRPVMAINQPALQITNFQITFSGSDTVTNAVDESTISFEKARSVPFDVPFGQCVFLDTTFLPGSLTLQVHGHEVTLIPRALIVDKTEYPWSRASPLVLPPR